MDSRPDSNQPHLDKCAPRTISRAKAIALAVLGHPVVFVHASKIGRGELKAGRYGFFRHLFKVCEELGFPVALMPHARPAYVARAGLRAVHIYFTFQDLPTGPRTIFASPGYLNDYWYFDQAGHRARSSTGRREFVQDGIEAADANALFAKLRRRYVRQQETSRYQPEDSASAIPDGAIALMLQYHRDDSAPRGAVCSELEMIDSVIRGRADRPVVIKTHPGGVQPATARAIERAERQFDNVQRMDANVHEILEKAKLVCCFNSATGFEAMLHRVPALLFADADFHHCQTRVTDLSEVPRQIEAALERKVNYPKYLY